MVNDSPDSSEGTNERKPHGILRRVLEYPYIVVQRRVVENELREALRNNSSELPNILARASLVRYLIKDKLLVRALDDPSSISNVMSALHNEDMQMELKKRAEREERKLKKEK
ncbi:MAG: hypothetical protein K9M03_01755 [Kiritimatiellales bacterium]|nr:hypothetical protein [Kiritimatiellales bacterium]